MEMKRMENYGQRQQKAWITMTLIVLNILYFVYLEAVGSSEDVLFMLEHGAMFGPLVLDGHEYYRLLTAVFMHFGINHIVICWCCLCWEIIWKGRLEKSSICFSIYYVVWERMLCQCFLIWGSRPMQSV